MCDYNAVMKQLAEYKRLQEETNSIIEGLQDELKTYMKDNKLDVLNGNEHKATYKPITSSRIDTTALKNELPYADFEDYMNEMLRQGREKVGGLVEAYGV